MRLHAGVRREAVERGSTGSRRRRRPRQDGFHEVHHWSHSRFGHEIASGTLVGFKKHRRDQAPRHGAFLLWHDIGSWWWLALARVAAAVLRRRVRVRRAALLDELPVDGGVLEIAAAPMDAAVAGEEERLGAEIRPRRGVVVQHRRRRLRDAHRCLS